ncbi:MAG TPA: hypothetical protein VFQ88_07595 [Nevskiaceae bacterium]|nr:hypothetical protein [Nevskiaceae bacterium]
MIRNRCRYTPYAERTRRFRRKTYVSLQWRIRCDPNGSGVFTTDQVLPGGTYMDGPALVRVPEDPPVHWADVRFVSQRHASSGCVYSASVRSAVHAAVDDAENWADDHVDARLTDDERASLLRPLVFEPAGRGCVRLVPRPELRLARFGNRTRHALRADALETWLPQYRGVRLRATLEPDHVYGQGLTLITPAPLTAASLAGVVEEFTRNGERPRLGELVPLSNPILADSLPRMIAKLAAWERWRDRRECGEEAGDPPPLPETGASVPLIARH